jgi:hypothetical protein
MAQTIFSAGNAVDGVSATRGDDGTLVFKTGASGSQVNALSLAADGTPTLIKPLTGGSLTMGTAVATTSGTAIDFIGIPSWVKRITVMLNGVSTNGASNKQIQIGSGSVDATSTYSGGVELNGTRTANTTGFLISRITAADSLNNGTAVLTLLSGNTWCITGLLDDSGASVVHLDLFAGTKALSGTLDRIRLTTVNGTDTFDAGSVNIMYEG